MVLCHVFSCFLLRIVMFCVTDCHVLRHGVSYLVSRIVIHCVTDYRLLRHCLSCLVSRIVMFLSRIVMFVSRIVTFCVTDYVIGFDLCSVVVYIKAWAKHISSIFMVKYAPL